MGLIYWNIINTLLQKSTNEPILYFNMTKYIINGEGPKKECDIMYSIPITYFKFENCIKFKSDNNCLKSFIISVDNKIDEIIDLYNLPFTNEIIRYVDNKDYPFNSTHRKTHEPFIIYQNKMYKLSHNSLTFIKDSKDIKIKSKMKFITHHKEIRTIKDELFKSKIILSFKTDYEQYLINDKLQKEDEYKFICRLTRI